MLSNGIEVWPSAGDIVYVCDYGNVITRAKCWGEKTKSKSVYGYLLFESADAWITLSSDQVFGRVFKTLKEAYCRALQGYQEDISKAVNAINNTVKNMTDAVDIPFPGESCAVKPAREIKI